jgi:hypothetical protein
MFEYFRHSFKVAEQLNQSISYAANFVLVRPLSRSRTRRFLIFDNVDDIDDDPLSRTSRLLVIDELDDAFDAAENDDGDIDEDEFVDNREDTVEGVESNERDTTTDEPTTFAMVLCFFFFVTADDLPFFAFDGGLLSLIAMLATDAGFVIFFT